ncbi:NYN domain-containing protein [Mucilaginibacter arboris]|uniref:NYN domain-containing protein n=1 Tax=Mucilaginibacter arboris TaxID=2682090 RepID=A0A7K1SWS0_9SPHI|nr:NYN domain-containing protein [Mucilaginibacter arboris]MVN21772.1 NYN domain-containing protein [Mucilaginibacter arboris]
MKANHNERIIAYIDGFNLYFGMKQSGNDTLWLNPKKLVLSLLKPNQELVHLNYFTSRIRNNPDKERRQNTYIEAIETLSDCKIVYGHYQSHIEECRKCGHTYPYSNEKMTDVNIAVSMMEDAFNDKYDAAFLITGDSDLVPPIKSIQSLFPSKRVFVGFPPNRFNVSVKNVSKGNMIIGRKKLKDAQFEDEVQKPNGFILKRPNGWR